MEKFGDRLKRLRKRKNISVSFISSSIGVSQSTFREWEYGRKIKGEPYQLICKELDVTLSYLMTGEEEKVEKYLLEIEDSIKRIREHL